MSKAFPDRKTLKLKPDEIPFATTGLEIGIPTIYADHIRGTVFSQGVCKLSLVENRPDALTSEMMARHVGTIVLPAGQVRAWGSFLTKVADEFLKKNTEEAEAPDGESA
jgi:hypothetical protein